MAINGCGDAFSRDSGEIDGFGKGDLAFRGGFNDGSGQRMFAGTFKAGGETKQLILGPWCESLNRNQARLAFGQRTRLVHYDRIDLLHDLQRFRVLDQHAGDSATTSSDHDRHRRCEPQRAGARDDEHGDRIHHCLSERWPYNERQQR